jgi:hypothetical protein
MNLRWIICLWNVESYCYLFHWIWWNVLNYLFRKIGKVIVDMNMRWIICISNVESYCYLFHWIWWNVLNYLFRKIKKGIVGMNPRWIICISNVESYCYLFHWICWNVLNYLFRKIEKGTVGVRRRKKRRLIWYVLGSYIRFFSSNYAIIKYLSNFEFIWRLHLRQRGTMHRRNILFNCMSNLTIEPNRLPHRMNRSDRSVRFLKHWFRLLWFKLIKKKRR